MGQGDLQLHHQRSKWHHPTVKFQVGSLVGIREAAFGRHCLPLGHVTKVYPGSDGLVRVVDMYDLVADQCSDSLLSYLIILTKLHLLPKTPVLASLSRSMFEPKMMSDTTLHIM